MSALRYIAFVAVGIVVASLLFLVLNFIVSSNFDATVDFVEDWIVRSMCSRYELSGTVRDNGGRPVAFAVVEASYLDERLTTRSGSDGRFKLVADEPICEQRPPRNVQLVVMADDYRPRSAVVPFDETTIEITLESRDFRP
jgi:hypothetical protein